MSKYIPAKLIYTIAEAEAATGFPHSRLYELIRNGELVTFKVGRRRMISARAVNDLIVRLEREAMPRDAA
ncbi:MAG TPA: helix-turn-helix domain-containing protein [Rhodanobacteraceae bacterium]|nr:helix-turn-helix domain-containing protein [Rhodanobacteraceae bacterium]